VTPCGLVYMCTKCSTSHLRTSQC